MSWRRTRAAFRGLALAITLAPAGACYTNQQIAVADLEGLTAAPGRPSQVEVKGESCDGCRVAVSVTTPLLLTTAEGAQHRMTPFYFHMSETQIVAPDYGVLIDRADVTRAEVSALSTSKTLALLAMVTAAAAGTFLAIHFTAGEEDLRAEK